MKTLARPLPVVRLAGLHLDTLGHYFAALGLLRLAVRKWPTVKCCWRDGVFFLVGGPQNLAEFEALLLEIGANGRWSSYAIDRPKNKSTDSQKIKGKDVSLWIAQLTDESDAVLGISHVVGGDRRNFNPIFGTGGNAGKRNFLKGWQKAKEAVEAKESATKSKKRNKDEQKNLPLLIENDALSKGMLPEARHDLAAFLNGATCSLLSDYGAACWFSAANKVYNFSPDKPYRDGQLTPWAMLFACEAFPLLVGATSRRIGSQRQGTGAFPFVTQGPAPKNEKEAGIVVGEFWAPVWSKPLSFPEVSAMFKRGRAEVDGRGAITSVAFAAAIIQKGTDIGLLEFRRFSLLHTTSAQTFESRLASIHPLADYVEAAQADAVAKIIRFRDALPREYKKGKSWIYRGLQGPIDHALVNLAETALNIDRRIDASWELLDAVFSSLAKTGKNKTHREREPSLALLPVSWAVSLLKSTHEISREASVAIALATLHSETSYTISTVEKSGNRPAPLLAYRIGVDPVWKNNWSKIKISKNTPLRVVWSQRALVDNLCAVIRRRVMVESESGAEPPFNARFSLSFAEVSAFLHNELDDALVDRWLTRFMLFDWNRISPTERDGIMKLLRKNVESVPLLPEDLLYTFFRPLFHSGTFAELAQHDGPGKRPIPTVNALRPLVAMLERGDSAAAHRGAVNRYKSLLQPTADFGKSSFDVSEPLRLLATLLLPTHPKSIAHAFARWVTPTKDQQ
jgi:CRISPR-associated protein Csx17